MVRTIRNILLVVTVCVTLVLDGCDGRSDLDPLALISSPAIPLSVQDVPNPLRGQYEDLLQPLFPQGNPAQRRYPAWPASYDASLRVPWRQLQPTDPSTLPPDAPDDRKFDFSVIDDALTKLAGRNMRLTLRVVAYNSCCDTVYPNNTNIAMPDWMGAAATNYSGPQRYWWMPGVTQVVPNWNDPNYLNAFGQLLAALGRRYDGDERLSVFEFSGYGDFSENHISYLRDTLGAPGPAPDESVAKLGYYSQFRDQNITAESIRQLVAATVNAFPHTQLVTTALNPEIVRQLIADDVTKKLSAPVGIRADCLGVQDPLPAWAERDGSHYVQSKDPLVGALRNRLASAPMITEWCQLPEKTDPRTYYEKGLQDVVKYHVSMTSSFNFPAVDSSTPMDPALYLLWARANVVAGYRYSVEARQESQSVKDGKATLAVAWTNYGAAAATENWVPGYRLVDFSGAVVRTLPATVALKTLVQSPSGDGSSKEPLPASTTESIHIDLAGLAPGHYTLCASVDWQQHKPGANHVVNYPPMRLARDGRDGTGCYPIATLNLSRDALTHAA
ncbi:hypothetical protein [Mycobacterium intracellulare]|uniref:DUF4832 domain-containing protein n=1 Tax=Mycobacterium intracellulare TaxID=1767 RepID=A0A7R7MQN6_MYCIT|nr:hypothetical protein [Mycobacterium intracellulare]UEB23914.1 hypothetical protein LK403_21945 [Mycobacterium intracellulare]UGU02262.1 hypothetical protein LTS63_00300 [Mycobacterium intracellulare]BCO61209.1 hypothetical protein MINTM006_11590 [Mycobacterium intracellulare]BCO71962.1 hypothetical protein MINTM008_12970 [Mycobacterium intracellulare]BCO77408.1 hypothetical protein MINTM009_11900 [Mycobacterium intracellulare]